MKKSIEIQKDQISQLLNHAEKSLPNEAVALLFGTISDNTFLARRIEYLSNESMNNRISFSIDPEVQYTLLMDADEHGELMVAIFHSHPAPPRPSSSDIKNMQLNPVVWMIASKTTGDWIMKAYILEKENPIEIDIHYIE